MDEKTVADLFTKNIACSQIVFSELSEQFGISKEEARKMASLFGGGLWSGEVCGAVSGAILALGIKYGHSEAGDEEGQKLGMEKLMKFKGRFEEEYKSIVCKKILGYDLSIPEEMKIIGEKRFFENFCPKLVCRTITIAQEIIDEE